MTYEGIVHRLHVNRANLPHFKARVEMIKLFFGLPDEK